MSQSNEKQSASESRIADFPINPLFTQRWSPRAFKEEPIPEEVLLSLFEAARWAPSGNNLQPWRYIVARSQKDRERFLGFINEFNADWCKRAPVYALLVSEKQNTEGKVINSHAFDAGSSWGYLALEAVNQGLVTHAMGGFDRVRARTELNIPERFEPQIVIAIGYQGDPRILNESQRQREQPNGRRTTLECLFEGQFDLAFQMNT
ncbi:nitroreductase family protein [Marinicrinis lubricantis]|uniref:Nitroreductase family protein n=1 Tax=Marinicrinis lubricantis TaxID=2086470 RepID=A0ABW1ITF7_9BACL